MAMGSLTLEGASTSIYFFKGASFLETGALVLVTALALVFDTDLDLDFGGAAFAFYEVAALPRATGLTFSSTASVDTFCPFLPFLRGASLCFSSWPRSLLS